MLNVGTNVSASGGKSDMWLGKGNAMFPDPFFDIASTAMPSSAATVLRYCEFIISQNPTLSQALRRIVSYFCTDIDIIDEEQSREEKDKFRTLLKDELKLMSFMNTILVDRLTYGNAFISVLTRFRRYLSCPGCAERGRASEYPLAQVYNTPAFEFRWAEFQFHAKCPNCAYHGPWSHRDRPGTNESDIYLKRWNPHEIEIIYDELWDDCAFIWKIPESYRSDVKRGTLFHLERANWEVIQAIKNNKHLRFDKDIIYHLKEPQLAGQYSRGWGISRVMTVFRQAWYVQILRRHNEAIAADYALPCRVLGPASRSGATAESTDPLLAADLSDVAGELSRIVMEHRRDPCSVHVSPIPIEYQVMGGEARALAPRELVAEGVDELLNGSGVPTEFYRGTLSMQTLYPAMRLFESQHAPLVQEANDLLKFIITAAANILQWEPVKARLLPPTIADDVNQQMAKLQLMMGRQISQTSGLQSLNLNFEEENRRMQEEEVFVAETQAENQKKLEGKQMQQSLVPTPIQLMMSGGGAMPMPGQPPADPSQGGGQPQVAASPGMQPGTPAAQYAASTGAGLSSKKMALPELMSMGQTIAQQMMTMPDSQQNMSMQQLREQNPVLHSYVRDTIAEAKAETRKRLEASQGQAASPM